MATCLVSLGSNLGDRRQTIEQAIARIDAHGLIQVTARSRLYETQPIGGPADQGSFFNAAIQLETSLPADGLLRFLQETESALGRTRDERWSARTIDLDLLLFDNTSESTDELTLPHPRMAFRRFVLEPAAEIAADMPVPPDDLTVQRLLERVKSLPNYVAITSATPSAAEEFGARLVSNLTDQHGVSARLLRNSVDGDGPPGFAADSTGRVIEAAIEFLGQRIEMLDAASQADSADVWFISGFGWSLPRELSAIRKDVIQSARFRRVLIEYLSAAAATKLNVHICDVDASATVVLRSMTMIFVGRADEQGAFNEVTAAVLAMHDVPQLVS